MVVISEKKCMCDSCNTEFVPENERQRFCLHCRENGFYKTCENCQSFFVAKHEKAKYCTEACRKEGLKLSNRTCLFCRNKFDAIATNQLYCSKECADMSNGKFTTIHTLNCEVCHEEFKSGDPRTLFCSHICEEQSDKRFCLHCSTPFHKTESDQVWCSSTCKEKLKQNECKRCNKTFYHKINKTFCSDVCRKKKCKKCDKAFVPKNNEVFCGDVCKKLFYTHVCVACEKEFFKQTKSARYCSLSCKDSLSTAEKHRKICKNCKKVMTVLNSDAHFCSSNCSIEFHKQKQNKKSKKKSDEEIKAIVIERVDILLEKKKKLLNENVFGTIDYWEVDGFTEDLKEKILRRDEYHCYICESDEDLEIHHILPRKLGGSHEEENLATLCRKCHRHIETGNREHAIKKCFKNAKLTLGVPEIKLIEKINKTEHLLYMENVIQNMYKKLVEQSNDELQETLVQFDDLIDEFAELKKSI